MLADSPLACIVDGPGSMTARQVDDLFDPDDFLARRGFLPCLRTVCHVLPQFGDTASGLIRISPWCGVLLGINNRRHQWGSRTHRQA